jgi:hypothetical protein
MKAIIDSITGELLFTTTLEIDITEGTVVLDSVPTGNYWNFEEEVWYSIVDNDELIKQALEIDLYYTGLISDLLRKHIEKLSIDNIPIPQSAIDERDRLRAECNQKILDLGITNFSYRQSNLRL